MASDLGCKSRIASAAKVCVSTIRTTRSINPEFATDIRKLLLGGAICEAGNPCAPVILICRSGKRSLDAGRTLLENGLKAVYHVSEGFEGDLNDDHQRSTIGGWRFHGLPWEQC